MTYDPNSNWTTQAAAADQAPVYFLRIDGITSEDYSTHPVQSAATTKTELVAGIDGTGTRVDVIDGTSTVSDLKIELLDIGDKITDIISNEAVGAPVSTVINRKATLYAGYRSLAESDYAAIFTGRISGIQMNRDRTGYILTVSNTLRRMRRQVMTNATESSPTILEGNPVNIYWSMLTGTFSTTHSTFPLDYVSSSDVQPNGNTTFGSDVSWNNPANAYDGDTGTNAAGTSSNTTDASVVFTFASGTDSGRLRAVAYVENFGEMRLLYSTDSGASWTEWAEVKNGNDADQNEHLGPVLESVTLANLQVRATVLKGGGTGRLLELELSQSAPTGLGIPSAELNETEMVSERDTWRTSDKARVVFFESEDCLQHLEDEFFRVWQCFPAVGGDGTIGLRFHVPALPASSASALTTDDHVTNVRSWKRLFSDHLNKFTILGDYDPVDDEYDTVLYNTETSEDTTDQTATGETVEYKAESRWIHTDLDGVNIATELAGRLRARYISTPAELVVRASFNRRNVEPGDSLAVTDPELPELLTGTRGITGQLMTVIALSTDFERGEVEMTLLDTGFRRYGVIAPNTTNDYGSATDQEKSTFAWVGATSTNYVGTSEPGYRMI